VSDDLVELEDDAGTIPVRRNREEGELDITPMIDITFLLLIFFLVTSNMKSDAIRNMPEARNGTQVAAQNSAVITIALADDGKTVDVFKGNGRAQENLISSADLALQESAIANYVAAEFAGSGSKARPKNHLLVKAEGLVPYGEVERISMAASQSGEVDSIETIFIGVEHKK